MVGPILSVILIALSGLVFLAMVLAMLVPAIRRRPVRWKLPLTFMLVSLCVAGYGAVSLAVWAVKTAPELAKQTIGGGTAVVLEGFGKTAGHFTEKWKNEALADVTPLQFTATGLTATSAPADQQRTVSVGMLVKNPTGREIDLGQIVKADFVLGQDDQGVSYRPQPLAGLDSILPPETTTRHTLHFLIDGRTTISKLSVAGTGQRTVIPIGGSR